MRLALTFSVVLGSATAAAQPCPQVRPTDPSGGIAHYDDLAAVTFADAPGGHVRVWYATSGPHAAESVNAALVGEVVEEAMAAFVDLGFAPPLGDGDYPACASNGGDGRLDVYLVAFPSGADGAAGVDRCHAGPTVTCSGFILLDHAFAGGGYPSYETAVRVVGPHELFHLVQDAYDAEMDRWWAEGTAQWAADRIHPGLGDLERFLPAFFADLRRPLDSPPGGVTAAWLYGSAIWPVFLDQRLGPDVVLAVHEELVLGTTPVLEATSAALSARGTSLASTFLEFSAFNAATGARASSEGYAAGAAYPEADLVALPAGLGTLHEGVLAGYGAHHFVSYEPRRVSLEGDSSAVAGLAIPFAGASLDLGARSALPADLEGPAVVVVAGQRRSKVDTPYRLGAEPLPPEPVDDPEPLEPSSPVSPAPSGESRGGCATARGVPEAHPSLAFILAASLVLRARRRPTLETPS